MGLLKLLYNNSFGLLMRGCRRSSTATAVELDHVLDSTQLSEVEFDPGEFPPLDSPDNVSLLPEKVLQKLVEKMNLEDFLALSATCRQLNEKMTTCCQLNFPMLLLYVTVDNGVLSFVYNLYSKDGSVRWLPEDAVRENPFTYQEFFIIFKALGRFELRDVVVNHYQKIQNRIQTVKVQTDCDVRSWGATLEEFDCFLQEVNCVQYMMSEIYQLPLEMVGHQALANIAVCGRFDYARRDVSQFAHYNPCIYLTAVPVKVVINAIQHCNRRLFTIVQHIYTYKDRAPEMLLFEQWLLKNGRDIRREADGQLWAVVDSQEQVEPRPVVYVNCNGNEIHLRSDFISSGTPV